MKQPFQNRAVLMKVSGTNNHYNGRFPNCELITQKQDLAKLFNKYMYICYTLCYAMLCYMPYTTQSMNSQNSNNTLLGHYSFRKIRFLFITILLNTTSVHRFNGWVFFYFVCFICVSMRLCFSHSFSV